MQYTIVGSTDRSHWRYSSLIFFPLVCSSEAYVWDTNECICAVDHYQTAAANETAAAMCIACPPGSTTESNTNSSECCKYNKAVIYIHWYFFLLNEFLTLVNSFQWSVVFDDGKYCHLKSSRVLELLWKLHLCHLNYICTLYHLIVYW